MNNLFNYLTKINNASEYWINYLIKYFFNLDIENQDIEYFKAISAIDALQNDDVEYEELPEDEEGEDDEEDGDDTVDMIHENETADEKSYYSDYDEETDEELEKELPDATGKKNGLFRTSFRAFLLSTFIPKYRWYR